jgi:hypothetical protein
VIVIQLPVTFTGPLIIVCVSNPNISCGEGYQIDDINDKTFAFENEQETKASNKSMCRVFKNVVGVGTRLEFENVREK